MVHIASRRAVQSTYELSGAAYFNCSSPSTILRCSSWFDCEVLYFPFPAQEPQLFSPTPSLFDGFSAFSPLSSVLRSYVEVVPDPRKFIAVVVLSYNVEGVSDQLVNEDQLNSCTLNFLGTIVDSNGKRFMVCVKMVMIGR